MRKQMSLFVWLSVVLGTLPCAAATNFGPRAASSADLTGGPAVRTRESVNYKKYQTRTNTTKTYQQKDAGNLYYTQPSNRSELYKQYDASGNASAKTVRTTRAETVRTTLQRKYYLAHPFFQPMKGKFGSLTDISYAGNSYDLSFTPLAGNSMSDTKAEWKMSQFAIKEDFSYGITDKIAVMAMAQYNVTDYKFDWSVAPDDKMDDSGLNLFGLGAQWRIADNTKWIATASAYYQHQKDMANTFILDLKGGYKISSSTVYGLLRGWYLNFDGDAYGNGVVGVTPRGDDAAIFLAYNTDSKDAFYVEGGIGVFSVLDKDWTLNVEAVFGGYDWHNQASIKAAIGWQPGDVFALNLYAKTSLYDSADGKNMEYWVFGSQDEDGNYLGQWMRHGDAEVDNYGEMTVGLQAVLYF